MVLFIVVGGSAYFFNVNDYSQWITKQIHQSTGYDVRFESFENTWLTDKQIVITGLALYQQQQQVLLINRLEIQVDNLDLWQRQLEIKSVSIQGVEVELHKPFILEETYVKNNQQIKPKSTDLENIKWERLHIAKFDITGLNAFLQNEEKKLLLEEASFVLNDLLIIKQKQLQLIPENLSFISDFQRLIVSDNNQKATIDNLQLSVNASLQQRQAMVNVSSDSVQLENNNSPPVLLQSLGFDLQLKGNKLSLSDFFVNAFSGSLALQADALLAIRLLPKPAIKVQKLILNSLVAKDMQLHTPILSGSNDNPSQSVKSELLPIGELLIESLNLENISVLSESKKWPLQLKSVDAQINNLTAIQDNQLIGVNQLDQQSANFALAFDYLLWKKMVIEQFNIAGSLEENDPAWKLLKGLFTKE